MPNISMLWVNSTLPNLSANVNMVVLAFITIKLPLIMFKFTPIKISSLYFIYYFDRGYFMKNRLQYKFN